MKLKIKYLFRVFFTKYPRQIKEISSVSLIRLSAIVCQLIYLKIYTHYLTKYDLGIYAFLCTISYFLNALVFIPIDYYQQSRIYKFLERRVALRVFVSFNIKLISSIVVLSIIISLFFVFRKKLIALYIMSAVFMAVVFYITTALRGALNTLEHKQIAAGIFLVEVLFKMAFFYLAVQFFSPTALILFVSNVLALSVVVIILAVIIRQLGILNTGKPETLNYREIFNFSLPISLSAVIYWLQMQGYSLFYVPLGFVEIVGVYATLCNIGKTGMNAVATIYGQIFLPNVYKTFGKYTKIYIRNALVISSLIFIVAWVFSDLIVSLTTKSDFIKYSKVILFGVANEAINLLIGVLVVYLTIKNITGIVMKSAIVGAVSMIILLGGVYLTRFINVYTVGLPIVFSQLLTAGYLAHIFRRHYTLAEISVKSTKEDFIMSHPEIEYENITTY